MTKEAEIDLKTSVTPVIFCGKLNQINKISWYKLKTIDRKCQLKLVGMFATQ